MQGEKLVREGDIKFRTTNPNRKIYVSGGVMQVYKDFEINEPS